MRARPSFDKAAIEILLEMRDEVAVARDYAWCVYLAIQSSLTGRQRSAVSAVSDAVGERLEQIERSIDSFIEGARRG